MPNLTRGQLIHKLEEKATFLIRSIENWNQTEVASFSAILECGRGDWTPFDLDKLEMFLNLEGWKCTVLWATGTCACFTFIPQPPIETMSAGVSLLKGESNGTL